MTIAQEKDYILKLSHTLRNEISYYNQLTQNKDYPEHLCGACFVLSYQIKKKLKLNIKLKEGHYEDSIIHVWAESENFLIDLTYSQIDKRYQNPLIISKKSKEYSHQYY
jgi:hypothetical protein